MQESLLPKTLRAMIFTPLFSSIFSASRKPQWLPNHQHYFFTCPPIFSVLCIRRTNTVASQKPLYCPPPKKVFSTDPHTGLAEDGPWCCQQLDTKSNTRPLNARSQSSKCLEAAALPTGSLGQSGPFQKADSTIDMQGNHQWRTLRFLKKCIHASSLFPQDKEQPGNNQGFLDTSCLALTTWTLKACKPPPLTMPRHVSVTTAGLRYLSPSLGMNKLDVSRKAGTASIFILIPPSNRQD